MALQPIQAIYPFGQFDGLDTEIATLLGGEVVSMGYVSTTGTDLHAADVADGYADPAAPVRPVVTRTLVAGMRPLFLADEGVSGYGTLFGVLVGGTVGQVVTGGPQLGPHTTAGSGKVTLWNYNGWYTVTLDAVDTTPTTGLQPTNFALRPGAALYATSQGRLTPNLSAAFESVVVARFSEFTTDGSRVTTKLSQISALNSPSSAVSNPVGGVFTRALINFNPEI